MKIIESQLINKYLKPLTFNNKNSLNLEDDVYYDSKNKFIFSTDTYEENIHFLNSANPSRFVKKIFRSAISDILCKGSQPITYFLSLSIKKINKKWLKNFTSQFKIESKKFGLFLGGGDTIRSKKLSISISVLGFTKKKPILRSNAKVGDDIYITGNLGDSYIGLLCKRKKINLGKYKSYFIRSYEEPKLPVKFSSFLYSFASSSIDISDGLIKDAKSICAASKCGATIDLLKIPSSNNAKKIFNMNKITFNKIYSKGDDYQILFTANRRYRKLIASISGKTNTKTTRIGVINPSKGVIIYVGDEMIDQSNLNSGYIHTFG